MPRHVDHPARRLQIAQAVWRLAARGGLEIVTMREVASEAGVSTRQVQYYFKTREQLLLDALVLRNEHDFQRVRAEVAKSASVEEALRTMLLAMLPLDEEGRMTTLIQLAYGVRAVTDCNLARYLTDHAEPALERLVEGLLRELYDDRDSGQIDLQLEAETLVALVNGMTYELVARTRVRDEAIALVDYNLSRIISAST